MKEDEIYWQVDPKPSNNDGKDKDKDKVYSNDASKSDSKGLSDGRIAGFAIASVVIINIIIGALLYSTKAAAASSASPLSTSSKLFPLQIPMYELNQLRFIYKQSNIKSKFIDY